MVPLLKRQLVDEAKWIGLEDFQQCIAIAQSFPGSLAVNGCVALGHYLLGWRGAVTAGASVLLPSVLVVLFCAANLPLLQQYRAAVPGLKAAATGLIALGAAVLVAPVLKSWGLVLETAAWLLVLMAFRVPATTMIVSAIILAFVRGASPRRVSRD
jgi:chromate transporter